MYICGVNYESICDGIGVRTTIFISGCLHNCFNCQSPDTHSFTYGSPVTSDMISMINEEMDKRTFLSGITLSGGDCMYSPTETISLIKKLHIPKNNIWCYTGFQFEEVVKNPNRYSLLKLVDVLVDGLYVDALRDITLPFRGSSNQRVIDVRASLKTGRIILLDI